ncbi:redoxin domain-containing protein [Alteromonadaceae bacterium M269]|nr:redoxin domain-containing protein [Alteromonadaceae bacterium M269]
MKKVAIFGLPLAFFLLAAVFLMRGLYSNPAERDSTLIGQPLPPFQLVDVMDEAIQYRNDALTGEVNLINVWGTWCQTCAVELPFLTQLKDQGVNVVGLYHELDSDPAFGVKSVDVIRTEITEMLKTLGNPYRFNMLDEGRRYSLDLGVTGAPETFLIDKSGKVRLHHIGDLNQRVWQSKFARLYSELESE